MLGLETCLGLETHLTGLGLGLVSKGLGLGTSGLVNITEDIVNSLTPYSCITRFFNSKKNYIHLPI